jgi:hypothetical protein
MAIADLTDLSTFPDGAPMDMTTIAVTGARVVLEWVARAWLSPRGSLFWAVSRGEDVRTLENSDHTLAEIEALRVSLEQEARQVTHVLDASVTLDTSGEQVSVRGDITLDDGTTHPLAVDISEAGAAIALFGSR